MVKKLSVAELQKVFIGRLLVPKLHGALQEVFDRELSSFGLTTRQASILASCDIGEATTMHDLARIYNLEPSSITRLVERLVKKGLLTRKRSKADRRHVAIEITLQGKKQLWEAIPVATEVAKNAWKTVTEQERAALESIVEKVTRNLETHYGPLHHNIQSRGEQ